ncbi:hypothetical protein GCM10008907_26060 [Clostridium sartagoforme]
MALNILDTISKALSPDTLIIAIPPSPIAVDIAQIVSNSFMSILLIKKSIVDFYFIYSLAKFNYHYLYYIPN